MPEDTNNPDRRSLGEGGCPSCADHPMGKALPGSTADVLVREYVPPTAEELAYTRRVYSRMQARGGLSVQSPVEAAESELTRGVLRRLNASETVLMPDISGIPTDPNGPVSVSMPHTSLEPHATSVTMMSGISQRATSGQDVLMPSQLTAPWKTNVQFQQDAENGDETEVPLGSFDEPLKYKDARRVDDTQDDGPRPPLPFAEDDFKELFANTTHPPASGPSGLKYRV